MLQEFAAARTDKGAVAPSNPLLMGLSPAQHVLSALEKVRPAEMEQALLMLPFSYALDLLKYLCFWLKKGLKVRETPRDRCTELLLRCHLRKRLRMAQAIAILVV